MSSILFINSFTLLTPPVIELNNSKSSTSTRTTKPFPSHNPHSSLTSKTTLALASCNCKETHTTHNIKIERIVSRSRVLDLLVFRRFSISACEYIRQQSEWDQTISEEEAIYHLTSNYDDKGQYLKGIGDPMVQFVAIACDGTATQMSSRQEETNGVVASIDAQIKRIPASSSSYNHNQSLESEVMTLPWPHVSLKNLNVDKEFRRMGIASSLVQLVGTYACEEQINAIVLEVDPDNVGAISLYRKEGYVEASDGRMVLTLK